MKEVPCRSNLFSIGRKTIERLPFSPIKNKLLRHGTFLLVFGLAASAAQQTAPPQPVSTARIRLFRIQSDLLTAYWGRPMFLEAGVVLPPGHDPEKNQPVCYIVHGFGGSHRSAWSRGPAMLEGMQTGTIPAMLYIFLNASCPRGHHEFADSANNGPVGEALITEFIPALEAKFGGPEKGGGRFLTGHSSGGWSTLWLQITYPRIFGGTWSTAPDPVDFRDFTGVNIYSDRNAYVDSHGDPVMMVRRNGEWVMSLKEFVERELARQPFGGQYSSFDAVFSPRGPDGRPMPLFDRDDGTIDSAVAQAWKKYDIALVLKKNWPRLRSLLQGKIHVWVGTQDTFRLEGAVALLQRQMARLGSDAEFLFVPGRDHGTLFAPHPEYWPDGMLARIFREMWTHWEHPGVR